MSAPGGSGAEALARKVCATLRGRGFQAWLVGGCVRDLVLGRVPKDFDVATDAAPDQVTLLFPRADLVGAHFGVVLVRDDGAQVEVATFRSDLAYSDGRRPDEVRFEKSPERDVMRRDFTINALLMNPQTGEVLDLVGGRADLERGVIRAIGAAEERFAEDHLRMLRAVRFAARFGFSIEPATAAAIRKLRTRIHDVSAERVRDELNRILLEGGARRGFEMLDELGLLEETLPEVAAMKGVAQPPQFHPEGDVWVHTLLLLERLDHPTVTLAWGALLHDVGKPPTFRVEDRIRFDGHVERGVEIAEGILNRLRFPAAEIRQIVALVANHMKFMDLARMRESTLKRFLRQEAFDEHLQLHRLDCLASHSDLESYRFAQERLTSLPTDVLKPAPLFTGDDLIAMGFRPGPAFSRMLRDVEDAQLEGKIGTKKEAREWIEGLFEPPEGRLKKPLS